MGTQKDSRDEQEREADSPENSVEGFGLINRELAELAFARRVLELAEDAHEPLFERLRYLTISNTLLDEFYKIRVASLRSRIRRGAGKTKRAELAEANRAADELMVRQHACWTHLHHDLESHGISIPGARDEHGIAQSEAETYFHRQLKGALSARVIAADDAFPFLPDDELFLIVSLERSGAVAHGLVSLPDNVERFSRLQGEGERFLLLEDVLEACLPDLFEDWETGEVALCHILREGDLKHEEEFSNLLRDVTKAVERRRRADVIRLKVSQGTSNRLASFVAHGCGLIGDDQWLGAAADENIIATEFVAIDGLLGLGDVMEIISHLSSNGFQDLQYQPAERSARELPKDSGSFFAAIRARNQILHFPYDDFAFIERWLAFAAEDPDVLSIKQTLYRSGVNSPIIEALKIAARKGKDVVVVIELEARDDEEANIRLSAELKEAGVKVVFGLEDKKVHVKVLMVTRRDGDRIRSYTDLSTGNFHSGNARRYTDLSWLSTDPIIARDIEELFDYLTSTEPPGPLEKIVLAPFSLRDRLRTEIGREIENARAGRPALIRAKLNKLTDKRLIDTLCVASQAGVEVRLVIRGACLLRPGVKDVSEKISIKSIVGRYLEHSRLVIFGCSSDRPRVFLSSADWMPHKLDRRVEALVPIEDANLVGALIDIFETCWKDETNSWWLEPSGDHVRDLKPEGFSAQRAFAEGESRIMGDGT